MRGKVTLVGAGPGDGGLMTLKGYRALQEAQTVVYDRLIGPEVMAMIPADAEKIDVGKRSACHKMPQSEINLLLLNKALEGKRVVRLKGGDPFVFGRGGEELELLQTHGIPFEVVPGVTSAIAAPAYAGIPATHRDYCSSVHIITGHARTGKPLSIDFEALVHTRGTLVFLMSVASMHDIIRGLLGAGMDPEMPAAMVEQGTMPGQRCCTAPLRALGARADEMHISSPAVLVVGKVCALKERFDWFDRLPLHGMQIIVTRPRERAGTLTERLRTLGAQVIEYPCICIQSITPCPALDAAIGHLRDYAWLCFTSPAGVERFCEEIASHGLDSRALGGIRIAVIGAGTARALAAYGLHADLMPELYDAAHLGESLAACADGKVLIPRAENGSPGLTAALDRAGIVYDEAAVYRTVYAHPDAEDLRRRLAAGEQIYAAFTSASTVRGFVSSLGADAPLRGVTGLCIGPQTADEAKKYGMSVHTAENATIDDLIELAIKIQKNRGNPDGHD